MFDGSSHAILPPHFRTGSFLDRPATWPAHWARQRQPHSRHRAYAGWLGDARSQLKPGIARMCYTFISLFLYFLPFCVVPSLMWPPAVTAALLDANGGAPATCYPWWLTNEVLFHWARRHSPSSTPSFCSHLALQRLPSLSPPGLDFLGTVSGCSSLAIAGTLLLNWFSIPLKKKKKE